jgi:CBS domain-containing protein
MHAGVVSCDAQTPLAEVAAMLAEARIHCVVVAGLTTSATGTRLTWGTVTDRDLIRALDHGEAGLTAGSVAGTELVTIAPDDSVGRAVQLMADHEVSHLVVVENDYPIGLISTLDVARAAAGS